MQFLDDSMRYQHDTTCNREEIQEGRKRLRDPEESERCVRQRPNDSMCYQQETTCNQEEIQEGIKRLRDSEESERCVRQQPNDTPDEEEKYCWSIIDCEKWFAMSSTDKNMWYIWYMRHRGIRSYLELWGEWLTMTPDDWKTFLSDINDCYECCVPGDGRSREMDGHDMGWDWKRLRDPEESERGMYGQS